MAKKRLLILFTPLIQLFLLELVFFNWPQTLKHFFFSPANTLLLVLFIINILIAAAIWLLLPPAAARLLARLEFIVWAWFLADSVILFSLLLPQNFVSHCCYLLSSLLLFFWLRILAFSPFDQQGHYQGTIANFSVFSSVIIVFFLFSFFYGLEFYLNISVWRLSLVMVLALAGIFYFLIKTSNASWRLGAIYLIINCLVLAEIAWTAFFLPFYFVLTGAIFTFCFYMASGLSRLSLLNKLTPKALKFYLIIGLGSLVLLLLTVRWV